MFDLDDFKRINDRIGHLEGDAVLVEVAECVRSVVRATDIPCRVGGDEFAVILPESSRDDAELLADRIAIAIRGAEDREDRRAQDLRRCRRAAAGGHRLPTCSSARTTRSYRAKNAGKARIVAS